MKNDERHRYNPKCPDCKPAILNPETGEVLPEDSPEMIQVMRIWNSLPFHQREAYINVTTFNSRKLSDMQALEVIAKKFEAAMKLADRKVN